MLQYPCKTLGFKNNMVYKIPPGGGGKPYPASGLNGFDSGIISVGIHSDSVELSIDCLQDENTTEAVESDSD